MTTFDSRERAFENKFAHEKQVEFNIEAKQSKFYGLWAAELLGLDEVEADDYAEELITVNTNSESYKGILNKVQTDFQEKGLDISNHMMEVQLQRCLSIATSQTMNGE